FRAHAAALLQQIPATGMDPAMRTIHEAALTGAAGDLERTREALARVDLADAVLDAEPTLLVPLAGAIIALRDEARAGALLPRVERRRGRWLTAGRVGMALVGPVDRYRAWMLDVLGKPGEALPLLEGAIAGARRLGLPAIEVELRLDRALIGGGSEAE